MIVVIFQFSYKFAVKINKNRGSTDGFFIYSFRTNHNIFPKMCSSCVATFAPSHRKLSYYFLNWIKSSHSVVMLRHKTLQPTWKTIFYYVFHEPIKVYFNHSSNMRKLPAMRQISLNFSKPLKWKLMEFNMDIICIIQNMDALEI